MYVCTCQEHTNPTVHTLYTFIYIICTYNVCTYVCLCVCVSRCFFWLFPFSLLCQNYDKIMRPFLRKNIKTKTKAIEIIYVHTYVFVCVQAYSMSVSMHVLVGPHVRPDTVTPALPLRCRRRTHCRISFEDDARSLRCQTFWLARAN